MALSLEALNIIDEMAAKYDDDINKAVKYAEKKIRNLDTFEEDQRSLVTSGIRDLVHDARHKYNRIVKTETRQNKPKGRPNQVNVLGSKDVIDIGNKWMRYCVGRRTLGDLLGKELPALANSERELSNGHQFNANLLETLIPLVKDDKKVSECITPKKLESIVNRLMG